ncbi:endonuclease III domain-containing protein [Sulfurimonas sp. HSL-1716]|uniref:endonuclease III domain-containing protein n=1 Tax=Hydrocurvibacter sulfurireducens TaxID=3131937 RepID=UPI0031F8A7AC
MANKILHIYKRLYETYGAQGWWPFMDGGYHPGEYDYPKNEAQIFEICLGVILTQNTTFTSVVKSLQNIKDMDCLDHESIQNISLEDLKKALRPSGYFNQKAAYILGFIDFFKNLNGRTPSRKELLAVKGIGEESADSILLYAYNRPEFVVDAYTKRLLSHLGLINERAKYEEIKMLMQNKIAEEIKEEKDIVAFYQEYHALIVAHAKRHYSKKPYGEGCFL